MPTNSEVPDCGTLVVQVAQVTVDILILIVQVLYSYILSLVSLIVRKQPKSVRGEIVLITGAGHGIGKELALLYASQGATVVIWDINEKNGTQTVKEIEQLGYPKAYFFLCDVSNRENVLTVAKDVQQSVGDVTILINNAGIMPTHPFLDHTKDEIQRIMDINVMAHFWTLEAFLPAMKRHNYGHIVSLSSSAGIFGIPNLVPYCCSKYAVRGLMEALFQECRADKKNEIKFTSIYPYMVDTGLCKKPVIKFHNLMPLVNPKEAAAEIMDAQRREQNEITIPRYIFYAHNLCRMLPLKAQLFIFDFIGVALESDLS
ncbi:epidermal retinol dehydrogenase 2-like isoform X1 [Tribolium madens]|uniref:epidermal retinol dehydrogenase 2-like isoform X1 n=1 Tax=Tribolium madens TaxID=41895 RepID=UPI001CF744E7|nr:epidermal retinol dehydrogenase 2-like isoform X1 [Tribolium madens]